MASAGEIVERYFDAWTSRLPEACWPTTLTSKGRSRRLTVRIR
jgi:hypothetical protein